MALCAPTFAPAIANMYLTEYTSRNNDGMSWGIETSNEFVSWYESLTEDEIDSVDFSIELLEQAGPMLGRPHVDTLKGSEIANLKELRVQHEGRPLRILFVFDPRRIG
jgi:hypothetical protein